jgi:hypothetical protein
MTRPRWHVSDLVYLVLVCGIAFAAYRYFWLPSPSPKHRVFLSAFLAALSMASLGSFFGRPPWRRPCQAFAAFGWLQLVFVVWGGFWVRTNADARQVAEGSQIGMALGVLCALLAAWLLEPTQPSQRELHSVSEAEAFHASESVG